MTGYNVEPVVASEIGVAEAIQRYRWVVFASPSAVEALFAGIRERPKGVLTGANYSPHWAYVAPVRPQAPEPQNPARARNAIAPVAGSTTSAAKSSAPEIDVTPSSKARRSWYVSIANIDKSPM